MKTDCKRPKVTGAVNCIYCNGLCDPDNDDFVVTRRKTINWFHRRCYHVYKTIGFDLINEDKNDV